MAYSWNDPLPDRSMYLPYGNAFISWGPVGFTVPRGGANLAPAAFYQPPAAPAAQAIPAAPAPAVTLNTELAPAGLPAQQSGSLAPANPDAYHNSNAATLAAPSLQANRGADRGQEVAAAPSVTHAAERVPHGRASPNDAADAAHASSTSSNQPSRASASTSTAARVSAAAGPIRDGPAAVGDVQARWSPVGSPQGSVAGDDQASDVEDGTVVGENDVMGEIDDDASTMLDEEEQFWIDDDGDEWDEVPRLRPVFAW